jgi:hypothetical protein
MPPLLNYPATPRRIYVHTGKTWDTEGWERILHSDLLAGRVLLDITSILLPVKKHPTSFGAIIGEVDIVGCKYRPGDENDNLYSKWHEVGMYGLLLANPILYEKPIPCKGKLGFFEPDIDVPIRM